MPWHSQKLTWQWKSNHLKMYSVMSYIRSYYWLQYIPKCLCKTKMTTQNLRQVTLNIRLLFPVVRTFRVVAAPKIHSNTPWCTCHLALQAILPKFCPFRNSGHHKIACKKDDHFALLLITWKAGGKRGCCTCQVFTNYHLWRGFVLETSCLEKPASICCTLSVVHCTLYPFIIFCCCFCWWVSSYIVQVLYNTTRCFKKQHHGKLGQKISARRSWVGFVGLGLRWFGFGVCQPWAARGSWGGPTGCESGWWSLAICQGLSGDVGLMLLFVVLGVRKDRGKIDGEWYREMV